MYTPIVNSTGDTVKTVVVIDASTSYLSATHIPYIVLAVSVGFIFNLQPASSISTPPLPNEMLPALTGEISRCELAPSASFHGHLSRLLQKWHRWNYRLSLLCSSTRIIMLFPVNANGGQSDVRTCIVLIVFIAIVSLAMPYRRKCL